jgi:hypothetical protein
MSYEIDAIIFMWIVGTQKVSLSFVINDFLV